MLKELRIFNLILVEAAEITFQGGLTAITGETGSGKTVLLEALKLATGSRADSDAVRRGAEKALVEAVFEIHEQPQIKALLEEAGVEWVPEEPLLLKREISQEGRSRAFINSQMVSLSLLQKLGHHLVDFTDQHAHHELRKEDFQRTSVDMYGGLTNLTKEAESLKTQLGKKRKEVATLEQSLQDAKKEKELATFELEEIQSANLKEDEEESLNAEHRRLAHVQEIGTKLESITTLLEEPPYALIAQLRKSSLLLKSAVALDPTLQEAEQMLEQGTVALDEVRHILQVYLDRLEGDPHRMSFLEARLAVYHKLYRKYGNPLTYLKTLSDRLTNLDHLEEKLQVAKKEQTALETQLLQARHLLTEKRKKAADKLARAITKILHTLHMPHAEMSIPISDPANPLEDENLVDFILHANRGEKSAHVKEHASGGELSRLMLALQTVLSEHQAIPLLVFDEVDANVGGQTASTIADKLVLIATHRQVLCVTHFPQVAKKCHHHIRIFKEESAKRTLTHLETLDSSGREREFSRMSG